MDQLARLNQIAVKIIGETSSEAYESDNVKIFIDSTTSFDISENEFQVIMNCLTELAYGFKEEIRERNSVQYQELEALLNRVTSYYSDRESSLLDKLGSQETAQLSFIISNSELNIIQISFSEVKNLIGEKSLARIGFNLHFIDDLSRKFKTDVSVQN